MTFYPVYSHQANGRPEGTKAVHYMFEYMDGCVWEVWRVSSTHIGGGTQERVEVYTWRQHAEPLPAEVKSACAVWCHNQMTMPIHEFLNKTLDQ